MIPTQKPSLIVLIFTVCLFNIACSSHSDKTQHVYQASSDPMSDVQSALDRAKARGKHLMVVLGALWCHDSTGLAKNFASNELSPILQQHYEVVFVDVGYYKDLRNITERFSLAHYFATPTVMLINQHTEQLLNADTMHIWGAADSVSMADYKAYFARYAKVTEPPLRNLSAKHIQQIKSFKAFHGKRLQSAYEKLAPALKRQDQTDETSEDFFKHWKEVKEYRMALQKDIQALYQYANLYPQLTLALPEYKPFSWEE